MLSGALSVVFLLIVPVVILTSLFGIASESEAELAAMLIDACCVAPLALISVITIGVFTGKFVHKALARVASTRGSHAERKVSFFIFGIAGVSVVLALLAFTFSLALGQERDALARIGADKKRKTCRIV